jgi:hypothetical protein
MTKFNPNKYSFELPTNLDQFNIQQLLSILDIYHLQKQSIQQLINNPIIPNSKSTYLQTEFELINNLISKLTQYLDSKFDHITLKPKLTIIK